MAISRDDSSREVTVYVLNQTDLDLIYDTNDSRYARAIGNYINRIDLNALNVEQIKKKKGKLPVFSLRAGIKERIFFTSCPTKAGGTALLILCVNPTHDYNLSILSNNELLNLFLDHIKAQDLDTAQQKESACTTSSSSTSKPLKTQFKKANFANNKLIELRSEQNMAIGSIAQINFICGEAGSGKTTICAGKFIDAIKYAQANGMQPQRKVYLSGNDRLNDTFRTEFLMQCKLNRIPYEYSRAVRAQTYEEFILEKLKKKYPERRYKVVGKNECIKWLEDRKRIYLKLSQQPSATSSLGPNVYEDVEALYKLFQSYSGYTETECISFAKRGSTITGEAEIKQVYKLMQAYNKMLATPANDQPHAIDLSLYIADDSVVARDEHIVFADEAHMLWPAQIVTLLNTISDDGQYYCAGDPYQNVIHVPYVDNFERLMRDKQYARFILNGSLRCPQSVRKFTRAVAELSNIINGGRTDTLLDDLTSDEKVNTEQGVVEWHAKDTFDLNVIKTAIAENITSVFLIITNLSSRRNICDTFGTPYVGTPEEFMGMEADTVVLFDILNESQFEKASSVFADRQAQGKAVYNPNKPKTKSTLSNNVCMTRLFIGATRALRRLYILVTNNHKTKTLSDYLQQAAKAANEIPATENTTNTDSMPGMVVMSTPTSANQLERLIRDRITHYQLGHDDLVPLFDREIEMRLSAESIEQLVLLQKNVSDTHILVLIEKALKQKEPKHEQPAVLGTTSKVKDDLARLNKTKTKKNDKTAVSNNQRNNNTPKDESSKDQRSIALGLSAIGLFPIEHTQEEYIRSKQIAVEDNYNKLCYFLSTFGRNLNSLFIIQIRQITNVICNIDSDKPVWNFRLNVKIGKNQNIEVDANALSHLLHLQASIYGKQSATISSVVTEAITDYIDRPENENFGLSHHSVSRLLLRGVNDSFESTLIYDLLSRFPEDLPDSINHSASAGYYTLGNVCQLILKLNEKLNFLSPTTSAQNLLLPPHYLAREIKNQVTGKTTSLIAQIAAGSVFNESCFRLFHSIMQNPAIFTEEVFISLLTTDCLHSNAIHYIALVSLSHGNRIPAVKQIFHLISENIPRLLTPNVIQTVFIYPGPENRSNLSPIIKSLAKMDASAEFLRLCVKYFSDQQKMSLLTQPIKEIYGEDDRTIDYLIETQAGRDLLYDLLLTANQLDLPITQMLLKDAGALARFITEMETFENSNLYELFEMAFKPDGFETDEVALKIIRLITIDAPTFNIADFTAFLTHRKDVLVDLSTPLDLLFCFGHEYLLELLVRFPAFTLKEFKRQLKAVDYEESLAINQSLIGLTTSTAGIQCLRILLMRWESLKEFAKIHLKAAEIETSNLGELSDNQVASLARQILKSINVTKSLNSNIQNAQTTPPDQRDHLDDTSDLIVKALNEFNKSQFSTTYSMLRLRPNIQEILSTLVSYNGKQRSFMHHLLCSGKPLTSNYISFCQNFSSTSGPLLFKLKESEWVLQHHFEVNAGQLVRCINECISNRTNIAAGIESIILNLGQIISEQNKYYVEMEKNRYRAFSRLLGKFAVTKLSLHDTENVTLLYLFAKYKSMALLKFFLKCARDHLSLSDLLMQVVQFPYSTDVNDTKTSIFDEVILAASEHDVGLEVFMYMMETMPSLAWDLRLQDRLFDESGHMSIFNRLTLTNDGIFKLHIIFELNIELIRQIPDKYIFSKNKNGNLRFNTAFMSKLFKNQRGQHILNLLAKREDVVAHLNKYQDIAMDFTNLAATINTIIMRESSANPSAVPTNLESIFYQPPILTSTRQQRRLKDKTNKKKNGK